MPDDLILFDAILALADRWRLAARWDNATALLRGAGPLGRELNENTEGRLLLLLARTLNDQSHFQASRAAEVGTALDELAMIAERTGDTTLAAGVWDQRGLALHYGFLDNREAGEPEHELVYFERSLSMRRESRDAAELAESLFHVGLAYQVVRRDIEQARPYFEQSAGYAQEAGDLSMLSYAVRHMGFVHYVNGDLAASEAALRESLRLREEAGFVAGIGTALIALASLLGEDLGRPDEAMELLQRARTVLEPIDARSYLARLDAQTRAIEAVR